MNEENNNSPKQKLILDSCILSYVSDKRVSAKVLEYLTELTDRGFELTISEITLYEQLAEAPKNKEEQIKQYLANFKRFLVDTNVILVSAAIASIYKVLALNNKSSFTIEIPDKIIAATSFLTSNPILTADINDYPRPLFNEAEDKLIIFQNGNRKQSLFLQILKPNYDIFSQKYQERP